MENINSGTILEKIRSLLGLTIDDFCTDMGWSNSQHYYAVRDGAKNKQGIKKKSSPTVNKLFDGINAAILSNPLWEEHKVEITKIVIDELFKGSSKTNKM